MKYKQITLPEALRILTTDNTYLRDVYFAVGGNCSDHEDFRGTGRRTGYVRVNRGSIYGNIEDVCCKLATKSLLGGIWVREEV